MIERIGPYRLDEEIGRGGMGIVYRGFDAAIGRTVAVKIIRPQQFSTAEEDAQLKLRFAREAAAAGKLSHPNIVVIYQLGEENGIQYMAMEFVAGLSLEQFLSRGGPMETDTTVSILRQIADALDFAHSEGIVHRDVKPANILVRADGRVKITDFGVARILSQTLTQAGITVGTPSYMAPEQILAARVDGKADQFSLGVIAYQMLSGRKPFDAGTGPGVIYQIMNAEPPSLNEVNTRLTPACAEVVHRALSKDPDGRYPNCSAFVRTLAESITVSPEPALALGDFYTAHGPAQRLRLSSRKDRRVAYYAYGAAGLAVLVVGIVLFWRTRTPTPPVPAPAKVQQAVPNQTTPPVEVNRAPTGGASDQVPKPDTSPVRVADKKPAKKAQEQGAKTDEELKKEIDDLLSTKN